MFWLLMACDLRRIEMQFLFVILLWLIVFMFSPMLALAFLVLLPILWLLALPFRVIGIVVDAILAFLRTIVLFPLRLLRAR